MMTTAISFRAIVPGTQIFVGIAMRVASWALPAWHADTPDDNLRPKKHL